MRVARDGSGCDDPISELAALKSVGSAAEVRVGPDRRRIAHVLAQDPTAFADMRAAAKRTVNERYSRRPCMPRLLKLIED